MKSLSSLILELSSLPKGNIYHKKIHGKDYFYHQYFDEGKRYSRLIPLAEVNELTKKINRRKQIIEELKDSNKSNLKRIDLSNNAKELTGSVMNKDEVVASFNKGELIYLNKEKAPLEIVRTKSLSSWLNSRVIDNTRVNSRLLFKVLKINEKNEELIPLYAHAASISDRYWFKPKQSKLKYKDVMFENDIFSDTSLEGNAIIYLDEPTPSPELTTIGSFEKGWKYIDEEWWLYKSGTQNEIFSELLAYQISKSLLIPSAIYEYDEPFIRTKNFAEHVNYESLKSYLGDDSSYGYVFHKLYELRPLFAKEYLKLIFCDVVVNNIDRHNENIGFLRNENSGQIIALAPNFDNNLAFISRNENLVLDPSYDGFVTHFLKEVSKDELMKKLYKELDISLLNEEIVQDCLDNVAIKYKNEKTIKEYILNRYRYLISHLKNK